MINIKENINNIDEFNYLYDAVGWGHYDKEISKKSLENTVYSISIYDNKKIIGYGRIIGDGICFIYVHDIMVVPEYQAKKIGTTIMNKLLEKVEKIKNENPNVRVYLGASKDKEEFYKKFGFITRKDAGLGAGMILKRDEDMDYRYETNDKAREFHKKRTAFIVIKDKLYYIRNNENIFWTKNSQKR